jgi:hypothetical protein
VVEGPSVGGGGPGRHSPGGPTSSFLLLYVALSNSASNMSLKNAYIYRFVAIISCYVGMMCRYT